VKPKKMKMPKIAGGKSDPEEAFKRKRKCFFDRKFIDTPIYDGSKLRSGNVISGHSVIEDPTSTTVIPSGYICKVDEYGTYVIGKKVQ